MVLSLTLQSPAANASCISGLNTQSVDLFGWEAMACSGITWQLMAQIRAALAQAALAAGASTPPEVTSYFHSGGLPYAGGPWGHWEVNVTLAAADAELAHQLAGALLANVQSLLPPEQYGQVVVTAVLLDGVPYNPPNKRTPRWLIALAVTLALLVAIACGEATARASLSSCHTPLAAPAWNAALCRQAGCPPCAWPRPLSQLSQPASQ